MRISPHELHVNDPEFYDQLYGTTLKLDKNPWITKQFGNQLSTMGTASHDLHKLRRKAIAPFLSSTRIIQLEGLITSKIEKLCNLFSRARDSKTALNIYSAYRATAVDIISDYCMAESWDFLDKSDFGRDWFRMIRNGSEAGFLLRQFPWFLPALKKLPYEWVIWLFPDAAATLGLHKVSLLSARTKQFFVLHLRIGPRLWRPHRNKKFSFSSSLVHIPLITSLQPLQKNEQQVKAILMAGPNAPYPKSHPPVFYDLLFNSSLPSHEKTIDRMAAEGTLLIIAGSESVGSALTSLHFRLLEHPDKYKILQDELRKAIPVESRIPRWAELKELPYLTACIEENLRITNPGVVHRLARLAPRDGIEYGKYSIPAGVYFPVLGSLPISLSLWISFSNNPHHIHSWPSIQKKKKVGKMTNPLTLPLQHIDSYKHELVQHAHEPHNFPFTQNLPSRALAFPTPRQQPQQQKQQSAQTLPRPFYKRPPTVSWNGAGIRRNVSHSSNYPPTLSPYGVVLH